MKNFKIIMTVAFAVAIFSSCQKEPSANFTASKTTAGINESITFSNSTSDGDSYEWTFGDGVSSTAENPTHSYATEGNFNVTLTAFSKNGKKDDNISLSMTVKDTKLNILVEDVDDPGYYVEGIEVEVYTSFTDWTDLTNAVGTGTTDVNGIILFTKCQPINYFISVFDYDAYSDWYDNDNLGVSDQEWITTGNLTFGVTNYFTAYVEYDSTMKKYILVKIEKGNALDNFTMIK
ncbi:MAG: PKD domain-containing protein [Bacteroidota bacterium]